jgi:hypothetical protein
VITLTYNDFIWIQNNLRKGGLNPMSFYLENDYYFELRFHHEGIEYRCVVYKSDIPTIQSRFDNTQPNVLDAPETKVIAYTNKDVEWFRINELFGFY